MSETRKRIIGVVQSKMDLFTKNNPDKKCIAVIVVGENEENSRMLEKIRIANSKIDTEVITVNITEAEAEEINPKPIPMKIYDIFPRLEMVVEPALFERPFKKTENMKEQQKLQQRNFNRRFKK